MGFGAGLQAQEAPAPAALQDAPAAPSAVAPQVAAPPQVVEPPQAAPPAAGTPATDPAPQKRLSRAEWEAAQAAAKAAKPPAAKAPAPDPVVPFSAPISPAARAYAAKARDVLTLELQVQEYEANTLGREDPETLTGYRRTRRERVEKDKFFHSLAGQFSIKPLAMPDPAQAPGASPAALKFYAALLRAYESTRDVRTLDQMHKYNQAFLKSQDWTARDRAVGLRDELMDRGVMFTTLTQRAWDLRHGTLADDAIPDLFAALHAEVPEAEEEASDLAVLVLGSQELRDRVMLEISGLLTTPLPTAEPLPPAEELTDEVVELQKDLMEKSGLTAVVEQHGLLGAELDKVDAELKDSPGKATLEKKVKLVSRRAEIEQQWYTTDPEPEAFESLAGAQEQLIRRRILDLDTMGALFGARLDAIVAARKDTDDTAWSRWQLLQSQRNLLIALDAAKPTTTPLDNVAPPPIYGLDLLEKAKAVQAAKTKPFGKPKGLGTFSGKSAAKPKAKPKPKPPGDSYGPN